MLEKNKDYIEMLVSSTDCAFTQNALTQISVDGHVYTPYMDLPTPGEFYIIISKEKFEKMQADDQYYRELAKQWEENYNLLLKKTGFDTVESLVYYLNDVHQCDTLLLALANYGNTIWALQTENKRLKKKSNEFDPMPDCKELLKELFSTEDVEKLEWTLNHICGGPSSVNGWRAVSSFWTQRYKTLSKLIGFSSIEEIRDYLTNEANCDTLHEALASLEYNVKFARDERRDLSKKLEECEKDYISERDKAEALEQEWKEGTGCPSPSSAKALIESMNAALRASNIAMQKELDQEIDKWQKATGRTSPEEAKQYIDRLKDRLNKIHDCSVDW